MDAIIPMWLSFMIGARLGDSALWAQYAIIWSHNFIPAQTAALIAVAGWAPVQKKNHAGTPDSKCRVEIAVYAMAAYPPAALI